MSLVIYFFMVGLPTNACGIAWPQFVNEFELLAKYTVLGLRMVYSRVYKSTPCRLAFAKLLLKVFLQVVGDATRCSTFKVVNVGTQYTLQCGWRAWW